MAEACRKQTSPNSTEIAMEGNLPSHVPVHSVGRSTDDVVLGIQSRINGKELSHCENEEKTCKQSCLVIVEIAPFV